MYMYNQKYTFKVQTTVAPIYNLLVLCNGQETFQYSWFYNKYSWMYIRMGLLIQQAIKK
jgi:hypothetical protein